MYLYYYLYIWKLAIDRVIMSTKFNNLKNDLQELEQNDEDNEALDTTHSSSGNTKIANYILFFAFIAMFVFFIGNRLSDLDNSSIPFNEITEELSEIIGSSNSYNSELLEGMREWMDDLDYGTLTNEELSELRDEGVTATQTQAFHDIGYQPTLDQLVELGRADVSSTYASMMQELGYDLSIDQLTETRRSGVTAYFTSKMMDLGYSLQDLTVKELIAMANVGVTHKMAEELINNRSIEERGTLPSISELKRYAISNQ